MKCLNPNCTNESRARGLCVYCYTSAIRLVKTKQRTWDELVAKGKALAPTVRKTKEWLMGT
jgi:hypothetical protein